MRGRRAVAAAALAALAACAHPGRLAAPIVQHATVQVSHEAVIEGDTSRVTLAWPRFEGGAPGVADSLTRAVEAFVLGGWAGSGPFAGDDSLAATFFGEQRRIRQATGLALPWHLDRRAEVAGDTLGTLSLALLESSHLGGAHGSATVRLCVFDRRDGRRLGFGDLFRPAARESLSAVCEPYFRTARGFTHDTALDTAGFAFASGRFTVNDNLALTDGGVRFRFDPYEIAPHALGPTDFTVPYAALASFARAGGPLRRQGR